MPTSLRAIALLALVLVGLSGPALASDDAQALIRQQEQAIARDDGDAAYSLAAPEIQAMFGNAGIFMRMVKQGYPPVYRHRSFEFGTATTTDGVMKQLVHIVDADGVAWEAIYTVERQPDGFLKISGCSLTKAVTA